MTKRTLFLLAAALGLAIPMQADEARLLRFPAVGGETVVFSYAGDLYSVPVTGGQARKLTEGDSYDLFPRISPDGTTIAFTGQYDGNTEVYTLPIEGGEPRRVTYSATLDRDNVGDRMGPNNIVMGWTPDGSKIVYRSRWHALNTMRGILCTVDAQGGFPQEIPSSEGGFCSYSPDGKKLAFNRMFREFRTWKHYRGGQAADIWVNTVGTTECVRLFADDSQNICPMWIGDDIYFISDRDFTMNLFKYDTRSGVTTKLTDFNEFDIKFPAASSKYIVFENGGYIYRYTVADGSCEKISVTLTDAHLAARPQWRRTVANGGERFYSLSPDAHRVLLTARGEVFSLPAEKGATYNLSLTPGAHERDAVWSPDGSHIAWFSDKEGEYQLYLLPTHRLQQPQEAKAVTAFADGYPTNLQWSRNGEWLFFTTEKCELYSYNLKRNALKCEAKGQYGRIYHVASSPDSRWVAYATAGHNSVSQIYLHSLESGESFAATSSWFDSGQPLFSDDGKFLYFTSQRSYNLIYSSVEWNSAYSQSSFLYLLPLTKEATLPTLPGGDEFVPAGSKEEADGGKEKSGGKEEAKKKKSDSAAIEIEPHGIVSRASLLLEAPAAYDLQLAVGDKLYYNVGSEFRELNLATLESKKLFDGYLMEYARQSGKALLREGGKLKVASLAAPGSGVAVPDAEVSYTVQPREEWRQLFDESWRIFRDHFYLADMHGVDWQAMRQRYAALLPYVNHRHDLTYLISEMIGELCVGHAYINSGETPAAPRIKMGLLGATFAQEKGFYRIEKIYSGFEGDPALQSPLARLGGQVSVGDYIVAIDGCPLDRCTDIQQPLVGKAGVTVAIDVNSKPSLDGARRLYVKPIADELKLVYYDWVTRNIARVEELSGGQVGYIHIPDMGPEGMDMFTKLFYSQLDKKALVVDDRMNGGGNVSPMILERLMREPYRMSMGRNRRTEPIPNQSHHGPKVCLIDKYSMSDGDLFPYGFQKLGLGKVMGMRTWGGIVGITSSYRFIDGQELRTPFFTSYSTEGEWIVENRGVVPDIEVDINPFEDYLGHDAQLDSAVQLMLDELKEYRPLPDVPASQGRTIKGAGGI